mmetsp:Transcript_33345/g.107263  ORF Transcript_33345/g.107263 Transcript_33345/m.107263 type:complete len:259 (-) Transcript_33345:260-1036(-)
MLAVVKVVVHAQHVVLVARVVLAQVSQELDLVERLVEEVLVVLDDLDANHLARVQVEALHRLGEGGRAEVLLDLVARRDQRVQPDREVLILLEAGPRALVHHPQLQRLEPRLGGAHPLHRVELRVGLLDHLLLALLVLLLLLLLRRRLHRLLRRRRHASRLLRRYLGEHLAHLLVGSLLVVLVLEGLHGVVHHLLEKARLGHLLLHVAHRLGDAFHLDELVHRLHDVRALGESAHDLCLAHLVLHLHHHRIHLRLAGV